MNTMKKAEDIKRIITQNIGYKICYISFISRLITEEKINEFDDINRKIKHKRKNS
jgi:hypothetical protein